MHKIKSQTSIDILRIMLRLQLRLIHADKLFALACILAKTVVSDSVKPGRKSRLTTEPADVLVRGKKSFLCQIVGQRNVGACTWPKQTPPARLVPPHQFP